MPDRIHLSSIHSWDRGIIKLYVGNAAFVLHKLLYLYLPRRWLYFWVSWQPRITFAMKINFILDPLGADVSANLCQDRFKMMAKRKFLYFISVLYCPIFLITEPGKTGSLGLFFCPAHLPTMDSVGPPFWPDFSLIIREMSCDSQAMESCILTCRSSFAHALGDLRLGRLHFIQDFAASEGQAHCVDSGASCPLSACLTFDVCPFCVSTGSQMSQLKDNILPPLPSHFRMNSGFLYG